MNNNILGGDTLFILQASTSLVGRKFMVEQGSLLKIKQFPSETPTSEIVKVLSIEPSGSSALTRKFSATVQRGWNQTTEFSYSDGDDVLLIDPQTIFKLEGSKVYQERQGKIYVQETQEIVHLDSFGQIISSSVNTTV